MRAEQRGRTSLRSVPNGRGSGVHPKKKIGNGAIRVILELICDFFKNVYLESGATPVYPEQLAGMPSCRRPETMPVMTLRDYDEHGCHSEAYPLKCMNERDSEYQNRMGRAVT